MCKSKAIILTYTHIKFFLSLLMQDLYVMMLEVSYINVCSVLFKEIMEKYNVELNNEEKKKLKNQQVLFFCSILKKVDVESILQMDIFFSVFNYSQLF